MRRGTRPQGTYWCQTTDTLGSCARKSILVCLPTVADRVAEIHMCQQALAGDCWRCKHLINFDPTWTQSRRHACATTPRSFRAVDQAWLHNSCIALPRICSAASLYSAMAAAAVLRPLKAHAVDAHTPRSRGIWCAYCWAPRVQPMLVWLRHGHTPICVVRGREVLQRREAEVAELRGESLALAQAEVSRRDEELRVCQAQARTVHLIRSILTRTQAEDPSFQVGGLWLLPWSSPRQHAQQLVAIGVSVLCTTQLCASCRCC